VASGGVGIWFLLCPMAGFNIGCKSEAMTRLSFTDDNVPPRIQSWSEILTKLLGLTTTSGGGCIILLQQNLYYRATLPIEIGCVKRNV
jgi:hypothetical protein